MPKKSRRTSLRRRHSGGSIFSFLDGNKDIHQDITNDTDNNSDSLSSTTSPLSMESSPRTWETFFFGKKMGGKTIKRISRGRKSKRRR